MFFPKLKAYKEKSLSVNKFGSLVFGEAVPDGCFADSLNLTGDKYPLMSARDKRAEYKSSYPLGFGGESVTAVLDTPSGLLICTETAVYLDGVKIEGAVLSGKTAFRQAILTGRNIFICPDGIYIKCTDEGVSVSLCNFTVSAPEAELTYCTEDGTDVFPQYFGDIPQSAVTGDTLVLSDGSKMELMGFTGEKWIKESDLYFRLCMPFDFTGISEGDSVHVKSKGGLLRDGYFTVKTVFSDSLVLSGNINSDGVIAQVTLSRRIPKMDFAVEHNNRIWACRYGENNEGEFVNEIYASRLGDPTEWGSFQGISTDSYTASLGCPGEFTGVGKVGNEVVFFKDSCLIRVLGSSPSEFTVYTVPGRGIEKGQHKSLVNLGERLFYKSAEGITVYDGTLPFLVSERDAFTGFKEAVAGYDGGKYVIAMTSPRGDRAVYVYDTGNGLWHKEDDSFYTLCMFRKDGNLFYVSRDNRVFVRDGKRLTPENSYLPLYGEVAFTPESEEEVLWYGETGKLCRNITSHNKRVRALRFSLTLSEDAVFRVLIKPDSAECFRELFFLDKKTDGIFSCCVRVPGCKFFTLRFEGQGDFTLHGIEAVTGLTGEVTDIE